VSVETCSSPLSGRRGSRLLGHTGRVDPRTAAFVAVAAVLVLTPGPDFAVVVRNALRGRRLGVATSAGTISGLLVHTVAAALGLSAVLAASALAFTLLKVAGAVYLCWLGVRALLSAGSHGASHQDLSQLATPLPARLAFRHGLLTNVLNPKAPLIFLSVLPQFIPRGVAVLPRTLLLSMILVGLAAVWYLSVAALVASVQPVLSRPAVRRRLDRVTGVVLISLGVRLALERRPLSA